MHSAVCLYGVPMQKGPDKQLESAIEKAKDAMSQEVKQERTPMSEADRSALRVALSEGKICWIDELQENGSVRSGKFRLTTDMELHQFVAGEWCYSGTKSSKWLSWSEVREPRVWEGEAPTTTMYHGPPGNIAGFVLSIDVPTPIPAKVRYRIEEILP